MNAGRLAIGLLAWGLALVGCARYGFLLSFAGAALIHLYIGR